MEPHVDLQLEAPWLVAAWPGMGGVAQIAANYLVQKLGARAMAEIPAADYFEAAAIDVTGGIARPARMPRSVFFGWKNPGNGHDLVIFLGEQQPPQRGHAFCQELLARADTLGVDRVFTFAAMATPIQPAAKPRVFAVVGHAGLLEELRGETVEVLQEGQIRGLNGLLLTVAAERSHDAACLLGEFPFFASGVPNPKAAGAVLRVFTRLAGVELDLGELEVQAAEIEQRLGELLQQLEQRAQSQASAEEASPGEEDWTEQEKRLEQEDRARIEQLFAEVQRDRSKTVELKAELDRQGVFKRYEDRFLDLFKQGE